MLSKNMFSKALNAGTVLAVSSLLLGSVFTSASWGMERAIEEEFGLPVNLGVVSKNVYSVSELQTICEVQNNPYVKRTVGSLTIRVSSGEMDQVPVSFRGIFQAYPDLTEMYITKMTLGYKEPGHSRIQELASHLPARLEKLTLLHCNVDDNGATFLANVLRNHPLKELALELNGIRDPGATALAGLEVNKGLKVLKLMGNQMTDIGAFALVKPLYEPTNTLKYLDIAANKNIGGLTGAKANEIAAKLKAKGVIVNF